MIHDHPTSSNTISGSVRTPFGNFILLLHESDTSPLRVFHKREIGGKTYESGTHWIYLVSITPSDFKALKQLIADWYPSPEDTAWVNGDLWVEVRSHFLSVLSIEPGVASHSARYLD